MQRIGHRIDRGSRTAAHRDHDRPRQVPTCAEGFFSPRSLTAGLDAIVEASAHTLVPLLEEREMSRARDTRPSGGGSSSRTPAGARADRRGVGARSGRGGIDRRVSRRGARRGRGAPLQRGLGRSGVIAGCLPRALDLEAEKTLLPHSSPRPTKAPRGARPRVSADRGAKAVPEELPFVTSRAWRSSCSDSRMRRRRPGSQVAQTR